MKSYLKILDQNNLSLFLLVLSDLFWGGSAFIVAYYIRNNLLGASIQPFPEYLQAMPVVAIILVGTFYSFGLYERRQRTTQISELYNLFRAITFVWLFIMAASFLYKYDYSRIFVVMFYALGIVFINFGRYIIRSIYRGLHKRGVSVTRVLIIGAGKPGKQVAEKLKDYDEFGYRVLGFVDDHAKGKGSTQILGKLDDLIALIKRHNIQEIFVTDPSISHERILELIHHCEQSNVKFKVVSDLFEIVAGDIDLNELEGLPSLDLRKHETRIFYHVFKRCADMGFSIVILILFSPFWLLIVLAIRLESPGKALFSQDRVGKNGKVFTIYKFRTMRHEVNPNDFAPTDKKDTRITRIGRFLRKTSLDEFPQFWNVIKGNMSVVGPRPEMPFIVETYKEWQRRRLDAKPGITGLWQILGRKDLPLHENIEYDFYYIKNQSLLLDLVILIKTVAAVFRGKGAY
jgi:exopolysaccharide biosynthesis polyprenyl glycosylphosphotransferase